MIIWLNDAFGSGKTTCFFELNRRLPNSFVYDAENNIKLQGRRFI